MTHDAIVVGAGPNGLVAANLLADQGWSVLVLEAQPDVGGAVRSADDVHPGFVHDTFSAFYPLAAASATIRSLQLEEQGLRWRRAPAVLGHPLPDGEWALLHADRAVTAALFDRAHPGDGAAWLDLCADWDRIGDQLLDGLLSPFPPVRAALGGLARLPGAGGLGFVKTLLAPAGELGRTRFGGVAPRILLAGNAGHADIPLDSSGSGLLALLMTMMGQTVGFPVPEGGAGELAHALARRFTSLGGEIRCDSEVIRIEVEHGRVSGVVLADGERIGVRRSVVADVAAPLLFGGLVDADDLPRRVALGMKRFTMDPGTVKVDWALDLGESMDVAKVAGLVTGLTGIVVVGSGAFDGVISAAGVTYAVLGAVSWAIGTVVFKRHHESLDVLWAVAIPFFVGGIVLTVLGAVTEGTTISWTPGFVAALAYAAVIGTGLAWGLWLGLVADGEAGRASAYIFMVPVVALLLGVVLLGETFRMTLVGGSVLVVLGVYLVNRRRAR